MLVKVDKVTMNVEMMINSEKESTVGGGVGKISKSIYVGIF